MEVRQVHHLRQRPHVEGVGQSQRAQNRKGQMAGTLPVVRIGLPLSGRGCESRTPPFKLTLGGNAEMGATSRKEQLEAMLKDEPNDPELRYMLAMEHASAGDDAGAVVCFRELTALCPDYAPGWHQGRWPCHGWGGWTRRGCCSSRGFRRR